MNNKIQGSCLLGSILLHNILVKKGESVIIVEGYLTTGEYYARHYWICVNGKQIDVASDSMRLLRPDIVDMYNKC